MRKIHAYFLGLAMGAVGMGVIAYLPKTPPKEGPVGAVEIYGHQTTIWSDGKGEYVVAPLRTCTALAWGGKHCESPNTVLYVGQVNGLQACVTKGV